MTTSAPAVSVAYIAWVAASWSEVSSRAYPSVLTSCAAPAAACTNAAPIDSICSPTSGRTSNARTLAPSDDAVPIAASPATPAPITNTVAGGVVPAAVTWPANMPPNSSAASTTARYPATFDMAESTSSACAREMRGTASSARAVTCRSASAATSSGRAAGPSCAMSVAPGRRSSSSSPDGGLTAVTTSDRHTSSRSTTCAPASTYARVGRFARSPAPASTTTS